MTLKVGFCAGHGGNNSTPGKRDPDGIYEWNYNDKVVDAFVNRLSQFEGVELKRFDDPTGKRDISLEDRTDAANAWGADIYISFHHNALKGVWGSHGGTETITQKGVGGPAVELAKMVHPKIVAAYGLRDRGLKTQNLHITRETKMPAILLEGGFMDSTTDIKKLRDNNVLTNAGAAVANGVVEYGKLKKKAIPVPPKPVVQPVAHNPNAYTVQDGDTLWGLSQKFKIGVAKLKSMNGLRSDLIKPGQKITVKEAVIAPTRTVTVLTGELWVYNKPDWNAKDQIVRKGSTFTISREVIVKGSRMYQLKSGLYITANPQYVKVK